MEAAGKTLDVFQAGCITPEFQQTLLSPASLYVPRQDRQQPYGGQGETCVIMQMHPNTHTHAHTLLTHHPRHYNWLSCPPDIVTFSLSARQSETQRLYTEETWADLKL